MLGSRWLSKRSLSTSTFGRKWFAGQQQPSSPPARSIVISRKGGPVTARTIKLRTSASEQLLTAFRFFPASSESPQRVCRIFAGCLRQWESNTSSTIVSCWICRVSGAYQANRCLAEGTWSTGCRCPRHAWPKISHVCVNVNEPPLRCTLVTVDGRRQIARSGKSSCADRPVVARHRTNGSGSKIGLDATNKWPPATAGGRQIAMDPAGVAAVTERWARLGCRS